MNKFEIGSQWKTRGGWRAVVVGHIPVGCFVWHEEDEKSYAHIEDGKRNSALSQHRYDLIEPWKEPVVHEGWQNYYPADMYCKIPKANSGLWKSRQAADEMAVDGRTACIPIKFTEGEGL